MRLDPHPALLKYYAIICLLTGPSLVIFDSSVVSWFLWIGVVLWLCLRMPVLPGFAIRLWWAAAWALTISCLFSLWWHGMNRQGLIDVGRYARVMLAYPFLCVLLAARPHPAWLWAGAALCGIVSGVVGGIDTWWFDNWRSSALGVLSPIFLASFASLAGALAAFGSGYFAVRRQWGLAVFGALGSIGGLVALASSGTRGSVLALPIYAVIGLWALTRQRQWWVACEIVVLLGVVIWLGLSIESPLQQRLAATMEELDFQTINPHDALIGTRLFMWEAAWLSFLDNPLIGQGIGRFNEMIAAHAANYSSVPARLLQHRQAHQDFLHLLAEQGLIGWLAWLIVLLGPLCAVRPALAARQVAVAGSLVVVVGGYIAYGLTESILVHTNWGRAFPFYIGATMALALGTVMSPTTSKQP